MPSSLVVQVATIDKLLPHPNADRLEIAHVLGWQCILPKAQHTAGEKVVYFPPDTMIPKSWSDTFGVTQYLSFKKSDPDYGRIRCARLRGEPSFGLVVACPSDKLAVGDDVAAFYSAKKWEPPVRTGAGNAASVHPAFIQYTGIENLRNFPGILQPDEEVVITEKIHGTNCRVGFVEARPQDLGEDSLMEDDGFMWVAGSHRVRRKPPEEPRKKHETLYWYPLSLDPVNQMLAHLRAEGHKQVVLFGEVYGNRVQGGFPYDTGQKLGFRAFDLFVDGSYLDYDDLVEVLWGFEMPMVPTLYRGPFSMEVVSTVCNGSCTLEGSSILSEDTIMEGGVVRPVVERTDPKIGRVVLKYLSDRYLLKDKKSDFKEE